MTTIAEVIRARQATRPARAPAQRSNLNNLPKLQTLLPQYLEKINAQPKIDETRAKLTALCPLHHDHDPSLRANIKAGKWVWYCSPCSKGGNIVTLHQARQGLPATLSGKFQAICQLEEMFGLQSPDPPPWKRPIKVAYDYVDVDGEMIFQVVRFSDTTDKKRMFSQRRPGGPYGWYWNLKEVTTTLYRLPQILAATPETPIFLVEGEKDADTLTAAGFVATCNPQGAKKWKPHYAEPLAGKWVVLIGDNDAVGREHIALLTRKLIGRVAKLSVIDLTKPWPECPKKGDVSDYIAAGGGVSRLIDHASDATVESDGKHEDEDQTREGMGTALRFTDSGNALLFEQLYTDKVAYLHDERTWLVWNGKQWKRDDDGAIYRLAMEVPEVIWQEARNADDEKARKFAAGAGDRRRIVNMLSLAENLPALASNSTNFDTDPWLIGTQNGTLNLQTAQLSPAKPEDRITRLVATDYSPGAKCPRWNQFLREVFNDDVEFISFLQHWFGYCLTGDMREQVFVFAFGLGRNGKSTLLRTITDVMGDYARRSPSSLFIQNPYGDDPKAASPELAQLQGIRLTFASESEENAKLAEARIKDVTGGEKISARLMYENFVEFTPCAKLVLCGNHKPNVAGTDHAIWRRIALVPFNRTFSDSEVDLTLNVVLKSETAGIFSWIVEGCMNWQATGLCIPRSVQAATADYRSAEDLIGNYLQDRVDFVRGTFISRADLYANFRKWSEEEGCRPDRILTRQKFNKQLSERGFTISQHGNQRGWLGITLKELNSNIDLNLE